MLGELGIPKDSPAGREQLEQCVETRRAQEDRDEFHPIRRGWCLGAETFRKELLASVGAANDEPFSANARRESTEEKARRILNEELDQLGWVATELAGRAKGDARKIRIARRLRAETAVTLKWIAAELHMGTWTHVANRLSEKPDQTNHQPNLMLCQK